MHKLKTLYLFFEQFSFIPSDSPYETSISKLLFMESENRDRNKYKLNKINEEQGQ